MKKNNNGLITDFFYTIITGIVVVAFIACFIIAAALLGFAFSEIFTFIFNVFSWDKMKTEVIKITEHRLQKWDL